MSERTQPEAAFERIAGRFAGEPGVTSGTGFGSNPGLRVGGKIFAMLSNGALVVKLPAARVDELVDQRLAERFDAGKGRPMREWATIDVARAPEWAGLADEAFAFVGSPPGRHPRS